MARAGRAPYLPAMALRILYDGDCGLCTGAAGWLARRDRRGALRLVPLSAPEAAPWRAHAGGAGPGGAPDTLVAVETLPGGGERVHLRAAAVARALSRLGLPWSLAGLALGLAPRPLADAAYRAVARRRGRAPPASGCLREIHR
jgi:predicted DCC family thiol-disulfide oxidoreductase YuxK